MLFFEEDLSYFLKVWDLNEIEYYFYCFYNLKDLYYWFINFIV